jgi:hypothetical protein
MKTNTDEKSKRRKIYKTEEVKTWEKLQQNRDTMQNNLDRLGYRETKEYNDDVSCLAW